MASKSPEVNNEFYDLLAETWMKGQDHPVALLRAEARLKNPWVREKIQTFLRPSPQNPRTVKVLDLGCGGGFLTNDLARAGYLVTGVDLSESSLEIARRYDSTGSVTYQQGDITRLDFPEKSFDVVTCMDVLEHVESPRQVVTEAARLLKDGGVFIFHTFNRTWLAKIIVIKAVEIFFKNVPERLHVISSFVKPRELADFCGENGLVATEWTGLRPVITLKNAWKILRTREVPEELSFVLCKSLQLGYMGVACKRQTEPDTQAPSAF